MSTVLYLTLALASAAAPHCGESERLRSELLRVASAAIPGRPLATLNSWLPYLADEPYAYACDDGLACVEFVVVMEDGSRFLGQGFEVALTPTGEICSVAPVPNSSVEWQLVSPHQLRHLARGTKLQDVVQLLCRPGRVNPSSNGGFVAQYSLPADESHTRSGFAYLHFNARQKLVRVERSYR